ncbi:dTDP-4-dehydrorhamnose 3,5-epimerase [Polynucleobacter sp. MWH-Aus1W21]|uniref:dTDP-4-dehydrorhamnose 3,5-epimerase n=1 Tax=Polynucleobacter sp. MWH-Aus1W21 TaxID=1855880 RepID=UPI001BFE4B68|nr:dTDP-4-dehydrorhamnose 3,5-epimerase [Polynucleobacter sp. MWH-Aus1W21]QWD66502.1 dTDP-4-dehydrorhamnose 3,5-epimerase [Polynucleobacter sp. MWH-Aus1W21]
MSSKLQITQTAIHGVFTVESKVFGDERGWFTESFNAHDFVSAASLDINFVQDGHSFSHQWTLRGLHYQLENTQGKLVRVIAGAVFDVAVDLRKDSPTYGKWTGTELSANNQKQVWIPPGLAHGYLVLSETAEFLYKTTNYYHPQSEVCLAWNDPAIGIEWPLPVGVQPNLSAKDVVGLSWDVAPKF